MDRPEGSTTRGDEVVCWRCGSTALIGTEGHGSTGVCSPDGGQEYRHWYGYRCLDCGAEEGI